MFFLDTFYTVSRSVAHLSLFSSLYKNSLLNKTIKMENENNTNQDCGCGTDCCTPKKSNLWMKIIFIVIVVAAAAIVTIKLTGAKNASANQSPAAAENSGCGGDSTMKCGGDTSKNCNGNIIKVTDSKKGSSCCPGNK